MLTVRTYLAPSSIHGIGLFAAEDIAANSMVWQFNPLVDKVFKEQTFLKVCQSLNAHALQHFLNSSYRRSGRYFYLTDNARFINHADGNDNIAFVDDRIEIALRDIRAHEELLENYSLAYDPDDFFFQELSDPNPVTYVLTLEMNGSFNVNSKNIS